MGNLPDTPFQQQIELLPVVYAVLLVFQDLNIKQQSGQADMYDFKVDRIYVLS